MKPAGPESGQPGQQLADGSVGEHAQHVRVGEGDVAEVHRAQIAPHLREHAAEEGEVVVLHQDHRAVGGFVVDDVGHRLVVGAVPVPGRMPVAVQARSTGEIEEVVVGVPEGRVGNDVVGHPVGVAVHRDRAELEGVVDHAPLGHRFHIGRPHRHRHPHGLAAGQERAQRRDQPTPSGDRLEVAPGVEAERQGPPVGDDDDVARHGRLRSSAARRTSTACGRSSWRGRLRWMRSPRSTWARTPAPRSVATSMSRPSSTP